MPKKKRCRVSPSFEDWVALRIANLGSPMRTYSIMRLNKGIIDCHDLYITVLDAVDSLSA